MQKVRHAEWFCPRTLMDHCVNLGLVVDLTNTSRYYDPQVFISQGIEYAKLFTEGKIIPRNNNVYKFFNVVNNFLKQNKDNEKLIGVHCTHGLNRTGYMICRYMIQQLRIPSDQAIADYNSARGHAQERENYLADLRKAEWINEAIPVVSVDVQKGSAITTINPFTSNSPDGTSTSIRRPSLDKYLKQENVKKQQSMEEMSEKEGSSQWKVVRKKERKVKRKTSKLTKVGDVESANLFAVLQDECSSTKF
nr:RNA/RNP complex-1-interacting phosphatase-like isoform X2 [Cherax quadricarinatus]